jgi:hypothetical protein
MSQLEAALYIQPPTLETTVAVQITAKVGWRNAAASDAGFAEEAALFASLMALSPPLSLSTT